MCEPNFRSTDPHLRWPRSDGHPSNWPPTGKKEGSGSGAWFEKVDDMHPKYKLYKEKVAAYLVDRLNMRHPAPNPRIDMPAGYALFVHNQPRDSGEIREDFYLFGSENARRFRSVPEFMPHAEWLFQTELPLDNHTKCQCRYNNQSDAAQDIKHRGQTTTGKRAYEDEKIEAAKRQRAEAKDESAVMPECATDRRSKRRFRKGELVFFCIETISPPAGSGLPPITHWPGLISGVVSKTLDGVDDGSASVNPAWTAFGAAPPDNKKQRIAWLHSIRPLGMFSTSAELHGKATSDMLPWAAGAQLLGGPEGWRQIGSEANRFLCEGAVLEAKEDPPQESDLLSDELDKRWRTRWGERIKFEKLPKAWNDAVLRLSIALSNGEAIAESWSQTDRLTLIAPHAIFTKEDVDKIENNVKTLYQGMWLRGERIWLSDMVRLRKHRSDLPPNKLLLAPSPGAENRGVFLKIRVIALDKLTPSNPPPGVSAAKPATDGTGEPSKEFWHCRLFGDVYELAEGEPSIEEDVKANDTKWPLDVVAPKGFYYRCINTEGSEIVLDVMDIAGRCYPDLLTADSAYFYAPDDATKSGREQANDSVMALTGLRPWPTPVAAPQAKAVPSWYRNDKAAPEWKEDLYVIVRDTTADIEWNVKECYVEKLCGELNYRVPDFAQLRGKANGK